jgi:hypothetical protein
MMLMNAKAEYLGASGGCTHGRLACTILHSWWLFAMGKCKLETSCFGASHP